jgi:hypothetical protein
MPLSLAAAKLTILRSGSRPAAWAAVGAGDGAPATGPRGLHLGLRARRLLPPGGRAARGGEGAGAGKGGGGA